jgi:hypothetical protein
MTKTSHDKRCGSYFVTYLVGRLLPRSPHVSLPPRFAPSSEHEPAHIPLEGEGRVWLGSELVCLLVALVIGPTSLRRGEGPMASS